MASFPWFSFLKAKSNVPESSAANAKTLKPDQSAKSVSFESIADKFEELQADLAYADDLCGQANIQFAKYRTEIYHFKQNIAFLQQQLAHRTAMYNELHAHAERQRLDLKMEKALSAQLQARQRLDLKKEKSLNAQLQARLATETNSLKAMTKQAQVAEQHRADAKFDIEYLKCTTSMVKPQFSPLVLNEETPLAPQPFVVVLVDGDAYGWSPDLFTNEGTPERSPGSSAAMQIKFEVTKYIRDQNGTIPFTSKIITRVFQNFQTIHAHQGASFGSRRGRQRRDWTTFSIRFTEKFPLFDFFDAGRGKERVDDKIREHFHLFLSHPNCYAIFLAACRDNGFARMLEPYVDHPCVHEKIVLVSSGFKASEIAELPFNTVLWPKVFTPTRAPKQALAKLDKASHERQINRTLSKLGLDKASTTRVRPLALTTGPEMLLDLLQPWNVRNAMARYFGFGTLQLDDLKRVEQKSSDELCVTSQAGQELD